MSDFHKPQVEAEVQMGEIGEEIVQGSEQMDMQKGMETESDWTGGGLEGSAFVGSGRQMEGAVAAHGVFFDDMVDYGAFLAVSK